jgi:hypothetical protein
MMNIESNDSPSVSISANEYFSYKADKLKDEVEYRLSKQYKKQKLWIIGFIIAFLVPVFYWVGYQSQIQRDYIKSIRYRSEQSDFIIREALQKLEISNNESEQRGNEISLLKKEILALKLEVEKLKDRIENSRHRHEIDGQFTKESGL